MRFPRIHTLRSPLADVWQRTNIAAIELWRRHTNTVPARTRARDLRRRSSRHLFLLETGSVPTTISLYRQIVEETRRSCTGCNRISPVAVFLSCLGGDRWKGHLWISRI